MKKAILLSLITTNFFLIYWLANAIRSDVVYQNRLQQSENRIVKKLKFIRRLQQAYKGQKGHFTDSWQNLIEFGKNDTIFLFNKIEKNKTDATSLVTSVTFETDTISQRSVYDLLMASTGYDLDLLQNVPGYSSQKFVLRMATKTIGGVRVEVIEVTCPITLGANEYLKFGSLESPTLAGNWRY